MYEIEYSREPTAQTPIALSLGHTTLDANNLSGQPFITGNYVSPQHELPLPWPDGDWYLRQTFVPAVQPGETVICNTLIPGLLDYYRQTGILSDDISVIEVEPSASQYGFPHTDPLENLGVEISDNETGFLLSTFTGRQITRQAVELGLSTVEQSPSEFSNNKARLREAATLYGFELLPGTIIFSHSQLDEIYQAEWNTNHGTWLKTATGSGGDLVQHIPGRLTPLNFFSALSVLREAVRLAFEAGGFSTTFDEYWPSGSLTPGGFPLVLEADARVLGEGAVNGSTQFISHKDGTTEIIGHFQQTTTSDGEYLGNEPFPELSSEIRDLAVNQAKLVGHYNAQENGYFGISAIDWFMIDQPASQARLVVAELNSRPTANTPPVIIAQKMNAGHFINTNVYTGRPIRDIQDFVEIVGAELAYGAADEAGLVVPQAFRTMVRRSEVLASPNFKVAILGKDREHCQQIVAQLALKGIRLEP